MKQSTFVLAALLLFAALAAAQTPRYTAAPVLLAGSVDATNPTCSSSVLSGAWNPAAAGMTKAIVWVAQSSTSPVSLCQSNGTSWVAVGAAAGSSVGTPPVGDPPGVKINFALCGDN